MNNSTVIDEIEIDLAERVTALDLYRRWEMQQWQAQSLEYERDAEGWTQLPAFARLPLLATLARFLIGETTVTETLAPLAYAAPEVDYKMYLATQLADEARHTVFFRRYLAFLSETLGNEELSQVSGIDRVGDLFEKALVDAVERVREDPADTVAWYEGVVVYHLLVEGAVAMTGLHTVLGTVRALPRFDILRTGITNVARDESRHISFGVLALRNGVRGGYREHIVEMIRGHLPAAARTLVDPETRDPFPRLVPVLQKRAEILSEQWEFAESSLGRRMTSIGIPRDIISELSEKWRESCAAAAGEYADIHGEPHPITYLVR
jgi:ribonucleoside-diphosphate reductase beta chain